MHLLPACRLPATAALVVAVLAASRLAAPAPTMAVGPPIVDLGSAASFAVLAGAGVAASGPSSVTGEVGAYPRPAVSDLLDASGGAVHRGDETAQLAQADLADAYAMAEGATPTGAALGGTLVDRTLAAGVYALSAPVLVAHLVLDGGGDRDATWILQLPADLVTAPGSTIDLVNGAQACNVFWQVGGVATLGASSAFAGTILATAAVTLEGDVTLDGRLLTTGGRVLLGGDTLATPTCTAVAGTSAARAAATAPPAAVSLAAATTVAVAGPDGRPPSVVPLVAIASLLLASLLGEPRRRGRIVVRRW